MLQKKLNKLFGQTNTLSEGHMKSVNATMRYHLPSAVDLGKFFSIDYFALSDGNCFSLIFFFFFFFFTLEMIVSVSRIQKEKKI